MDVSKITADGDCSHEIKRRLLLGRKVMTNLDTILKSRDITLPTKVRLVKAMVFPVVMYVELCVEPAGLCGRCTGVAVPLRVVPSPTGLPSKRSSLSRVATGNPGFPRLVPEISGSL